MGVDLANESGEAFYFSNSGWRNIVAFAEANAWTPLDADADVFSGNEAAAMADALEVGMRDRSPVDIGDQLTRLLVTPSASPMFPSDPIRFDEKSMIHWQTFIQFARRGGFRLEC